VFVLSVMPWASPEARRAMPPLKRWARVVFAVYVLVTVPALVALFVLMVRSVPRVLATAWDALGQQGQAFVQAQSTVDVLGMSGAAVQSLLILLPVAGLVFSLYSIGRMVAQRAWQWSAGSSRRRGLVSLG